MKRLTTIALVDWSWTGHHPSYFKLFVRALLELGCTVLALCPKPEEVRLALHDLDAATLARLTLRQIEWVHPPRFFPRRLHRFSQPLRTLHRVNKSLRQWQAQHGTPIELLFFGCIYDYQFRRFRDLEWLLPCRWSGLYLHCRAFRKPGSVVPQTGELPCPERFFVSRKLHSIAILDEGATQALERLSGRPVLTFPDLTEELIDTHPNPLAAKLTRFAAGAPIIVAPGHLQYTKGITTLARAALDPANKDLFFVLAGEIDWYSFNSEDRNLISSLMDRCPNVYTHFARIPDGPAFNSVIQACDIVFAAYLDFPNSSNILTKAAAFRKPVIVSDGFLMAERTRKFRLGEVVPEGDAEATSQAIRRILQKDGAWVAENRPMWKEYHANHCYSLLKDSFAALLSAK